MVITIIGVLTLMFAILAISISLLSYKSISDISEQYIERQMQMEAQALGRFFEKHLYSAQSMGASVTIAKDRGTLTRENVNDILIAVLKEHPQAYDTWFVWEPNLFDGDDASFEGRFDSDENGRFVPLAYRDGNDYLIDKCYAYDTDAYYLEPKRTLKPYISEPVVYDIGGVDVNMVTIVAPIVIDGVFYGAAGIDIGVDEILTTTNAVKLFDTGYVKLIGSTGTTISHRTVERVGTLAEEFEGEDGTSILNKIVAGESYSEIMYSTSLDSNAYKLFIPFSISEHGPTWILGATIPMNEINRSASILRTIIIAISIGSLLIIGIIVYLYISNVTGAISLVSESARYISEGNLAAAIDSKLLNKEDEIGTLAKSFSQMKDELSTIAKQIVDSSQRIGKASSELHNGAEQSAITSEDIARAVEEIARGASDQAKDTEKGSAEVMELGNIIERTQAAIAILTEDAKRVLHVVGEGTQSVQHLDQQAQTTHKEIGVIGEGISSTYYSVNRIKEVSSFIASISEQTNLLALNASIEAARAGEHGKGFAVVADEIRKLAEESKKSTQEIDVAIHKLNVDAENLVTVAESLKNVINEQQKGMTTTKDQFSDIQSAIESIVAEINKMSGSSSEMYNKKNHIMEVMINLSAIAEENAASTEQTAASSEEQTAAMHEISRMSEELDALAVELKVASQYFKL